MATLTETAYFSRQGLKYTLIALVALLFLKIIIGEIGPLRQRLFPPPPPQPNVFFGPLPPIKFPEGKTPSEPITYTADFIGGVLPESSSSARVYFMPQPALSLLTLDRANELAQNLGFKSQPEPLSPTLYRWVDSEQPFRTLKREISTGNFTLNYDFFRDPSVLTEKELPYGKEAISEVMRFLERYNLRTANLREDEGKVTFWKLVGTDFVPVASVSEAEITRVDLFHTPMDNLSLVTPSYKWAPVYFLLSGSSGKKRILSFQYIFRIVEQGIFATYPLKTTQEAWADLEDGKGYVANMGEVKGTHATIRRVFLAYYDSEVYESYLQPVFVFEGDEGFTAYVPAVVKAWVAQPTGDSQKPS